MPEFGIFNDEGCIENQCYSMAEAEERRDWYIAQGEHPDDLFALEICPDHEEQAKSYCEECF